MSIYHYNYATNLPELKDLPGLTMGTSEDIELLSILCDLPDEVIRKRLASDNSVYIASYQGEPVSFGWVASGKAYIGELAHEFVIPENERYLWNFRTLAHRRGLGIYPRLLQHIIKEELANNLWIIHAPENNASFRGITKGGFEKVGDLLVGESLLPEVTLLSADASVRAALAYMDFTINFQAESNCWNCSSPFLKKRAKECCCAKNDTHCLNSKFSELSASDVNLSIV